MIVFLLREILVCNHLEMTFETQFRNWYILHLQFSSRQESTCDRLSLKRSVSDGAMADAVSFNILTDIPSGPADFDVLRVFRR
jgi:hypothetical protein